MVFHTDVVSADPADYLYLGESTFRNIFYTSETVSMPINGTGAVASWEIIDHAGLTVATGGAIAGGSGRTWTAPPLPTGWYRVLLYRSSPVAGFGLNQGSGGFIVTRAVAGMPPRPPANLPGAGGDGQSDAGLMAFLLSGPVRLVADAGDPTFQRASQQAGVDIHDTYYAPYDTARPKPKLITFPNGTEPSSDPAVNAANIAAIVNQYPSIDYWEGANEPGGVPYSWFAPVTQRFYQNVKAARPSAKVCGPCPVTINGAALPDIRSFLNAGGGQWLDVWSFHTYNAHLGDLRLGRRSWDGWQALLTEFGQWGKPRLNTEAASFFITEFGAGQMLRQAHRTMLDLLLNEQYGVQKEFWSYFYSNNRGFLPYPSWIESVSTTNVEQSPTVALMLTHSQELLGATFEARLDFGTVDNDYLIGSRYRRADGSGVVALLSAGRSSAPVTLQLTGGNPASLNVVTGWGRTSTATVTGGLATIAVGTIPVYVELPAGATATPVDGAARLGSPRSFASATVSGAAGATFVDTFNRADGALGNGWTSTSSPAVVISGGHAAPAVANAQTEAIAVRNFGTADGVITITPVDPAATTHGIVCRYTDANNFIQLLSNNIYRVQGGVWTATGGVAQNLQGVEAIVMRGPDIYGYSGGVQQWAHTEPFNQTATVHGFQLGANLAKFSFAAGSSGSYRIGDPGTIIDGSWNNALYYSVDNAGDLRSVWESDGSPTSGAPVDVTLTFASPTYVDRLLVHCPPAWQADMSVIRDADLQVSVGGVWSTVSTSFGYKPRVEAIHSTRLVDGYVEAWDLDVHSFDLTFPRTLADALRLRVREVSAGGMPSAAAMSAFGATTPGGQAVSVGMGNDTPRVSLQHVAAFDGGVPAPAVGNPYVVRTIT